MFHKLSLCTLIHMYVYVYTSLFYAKKNFFVYKPTYVCRYVSKYIFTHIYTYLHIHTHTYILYVSTYAGVCFYKRLIFPRVKILQIVYECIGNIFIEITNKLYI